MGRFYMEDDDYDLEWYGAGRISSMVDTIAEHYVDVDVTTDGDKGASINANKQVQITDPSYLKDNGMRAYQAMDVSLYSAAHEGAHAKYSDFEVLETINDHVRTEGFKPKDYDMLFQIAEDFRVDTETSKARPGFTFMRKKAMQAMLNSFATPKIQTEQQLQSATDDELNLIRYQMLSALTYGADLRQDEFMFGFDGGKYGMKPSTTGWKNPVLAPLWDEVEPIANQLMDAVKKAECTQDVVDITDEVYDMFYERIPPQGSQSPEGDDEGDEEGQQQKSKGGKGKGDEGDDEDSEDSDSDDDSDGDSDDENDDDDDDSDDDDDGDDDDSPEKERRRQQAKKDVENSIAKATGAIGDSGQGSDLFSKLIPENTKQSMDRKYMAKASTRLEKKGTLAQMQKLSYYDKYKLWTKEEKQAMQRLVCKDAHQDGNIEYIDLVGYKAETYLAQGHVERSPKNHAVSRNEFNKESTALLLKQMEQKFDQMEVNRGILPLKNTKGHRHKGNVYTMQMLNDMARQLGSKILEAMKAARTERGYVSDNGTIIANKAYRAVNMDDSRVFYKPDFFEEGGYAVDLLVDCSGSTSSMAQEIRLQSFVVARALTYAHIPHKVSCFTTDSTNVIHLRMRDFEDPDIFDMACLTFDSMGSNRDGLSIRIEEQMLKQRSEENKLMIVLSDGSPAHSFSKEQLGIQDYCGDINSFYMMGSTRVNSTAIKDVNMNVRRIRSEGIGLFGIFVGPPSDKSGLKRELDMYGNEFAHITDMQQFVPRVGRLLVDYILRTVQ